MKFINNNADRKMRFGEAGNYSWKTVKTGEVVELSLEQGQAYGFDFVEEGEESESPAEEKPETTEGEAGTKTVETKQAEVDSDADSEPEKSDNSDEESTE